VRHEPQHLIILKRWGSCLTPAYVVPAHLKCLYKVPTSLKNLQPQIVWAHFATLCAIPRSSLHEAALREYLIGWAQARGITAIVDDAGNLILKKPASTGCEAMPGVILQGHLDMVCQANTGTKHDFERDPINAVVRDGWVVAEDTTLGADNGIGVALALAALEEPGLIHPPLEVLLTVNEESGMDGARGLAPGTLQGRTLINLDTEEWGYFYLGCAGGVDVEVRNSHESVRPEPGEGEMASPVHGSTSSPRTGEVLEKVPPDYALLRFEVSGLRGGHSGIDIHLGRGNAIKLLAEALRDLSAHTDLRLIEMKGGTARNAIPREAFDLCAARCAGVDDRRVGAASARGMAAAVRGGGCQHFVLMPALRHNTGNIHCAHRAGAPARFPQ